MHRSQAICVRLDMSAFNDDIAQLKHQKSKRLLDRQPAIDPATHLGGEGRQGALDSPGAHLP